MNTWQHSGKFVEMNWYYMLQYIYVDALIGNHDAWHFKKKKKLQSSYLQSEDSLN